MTAKKMIHLLLFLALVSPIAIHAKGLKKGMKFLAARHFLISSGWRPIDVHKGDYNPTLGIADNLVDAGIKEVETCAMDKLLCIFNYKKIINAFDFLQRARK